jgi:2'-5' RNA ligase
MSLRRVFLALPFASSDKETVAALQARAKSLFSNVHWIPSDNFHITLKFFGEVSERRVDEIVAACPGVAAGVRPFALTFGSLDFFGRLRQPRVLFIKEGEWPDDFKALVDKVVAKFYDPGERPLTAHLTLAKFREAHGKDEEISADENARMLERVIPRLVERIAARLERVSEGQPAPAHPPKNPLEFDPIVVRFARFVLFESVFVGRAVTYREVADFKLAP